MFDPKIEQKSIENQSTNQPNNTKIEKRKSVFRIGRAIGFVASAMLSSAPKPLKNRSNINQKTSQKSIRKLVRYLFHLRSILEAFWGPSWLQISSKIDSITDQKHDKDLYRFLIALGSLWGAILALCWGGLRAMFAPKPS